MKAEKEVNEANELRRKADEEMKRQAHLVRKMTIREALWVYEKACLRGDYSCLSVKLPCNLQEMSYDEIEFATRTEDSEFRDAFLAMIRDLWALRASGTAITARFKESGDM